MAYTAPCPITDIRFDPSPGGFGSDGPSRRIGRWWLKRAMGPPNHLYISRRDPLTHEAVVLEGYPGKILLQPFEAERFLLWGPCWATAPDISQTAASWARKRVEDLLRLTPSSLLRHVDDPATLNPHQSHQLASQPLLRSLREAHPELQIREAIPDCGQEIFATPHSRAAAAFCQGGQTSRRAARAVDRFLAGRGEVPHGKASLLVAARHLPPDAVADVAEHGAERDHTDTGAVPRDVALAFGAILGRLPMARARTLLIETIRARDSPDVAKAAVHADTLGILEIQDVRSIGDLRNQTAMAPGGQLQGTAERSEPRSDVSDTGALPVGIARLDGRPTGIEGHVFRVIPPGDSHAFSRAGRQMRNCLADFAPGGCFEINPDHAVLLVVDEQTATPRHAIEVKLHGAVVQWEGPGNTRPPQDEIEEISRSLRRFNVAGLPTVPN